MTWFQAVYRCSQIGAKLFELDGREDDELYDKLRFHMDRNHRFTSRPTSFWIRLFKREWVWDHNPTERTLLYSNWEIDSPSSEKQNCSAINSEGFWEDAECNRKYSYVCQYDNMTIASKRAMTTFPPFVKNTLRPLEEDPVKRQPFSFKKHGIWLILAGSVLLVFVMIFITVAYCRYCHRVKKERKKFTLYYGIDVGSAKEKGEDGKENPAYLDVNAPPLANGIRPPGGECEYANDPELAEYGYAGSIQQTKPVKPQAKRKSKYRKGNVYVN